MKTQYTIRFVHQPQNASFCLEDTISIIRPASQKEITQRGAETIVRQHLQSIGITNAKQLRSVSVVSIQTAVRA